MRTRHLLTVEGCLSRTISLALGREGSTSRSDAFHTVTGFFRVSWIALSVASLRSPASLLTVTSAGIGIQHRLYLPQPYVVVVVEGTKVLVHVAGPFDLKPCPEVRNSKTPERPVRIFRFLRHFP